MSSLPGETGEAEPLKNVILLRMLRTPSSINRLTSLKHSRMTKESSDARQKPGLIGRALVVAPGAEQSNPLTVSHSSGLRDVVNKLPTEYTTA